MGQREPEGPRARDRRGPEEGPRCWSSPSSLFHILAPFPSHSDTANTLCTPTQKHRPRPWHGDRGSWGCRYALKCMPPLASRSRHVAQSPFLRGALPAVHANARGLIGIARETLNLLLRFFYTLEIYYRNLELLFNSFTTFNYLCFYCSKYFYWSLCILS